MIPNYFLSLLMIPLAACSSHRKEELSGMVKKQPNIIFFIADDMTLEMFNCMPEGNGKNLTPNIDKLAEEGVIMMGQHVSSTVCSPSRFTCLTGKYASRAHNPEFTNLMEDNHGQSVIQWNTKIMQGDQNIAALLKDEGYVTGAAGKNHVFLVPEWDSVPLTADTTDKNVIATLEENNEKLKQAYLTSGFDFADGLWFDNPDYNGPLSLAKHNMDWTTEKALDFLDSVKDTTFFLYFATTIPHGPTDADRSWNADRTIVPFGRLEKAPNVLPPKETIPKRLVEAGIARENFIPDRKANLLWLDDALGALIQKLKDNGQYENTIIVFFSDHGQNAKGTVYQAGTESPSIFWRHGGFTTDHIMHTKISNIDFAPTLLEFAGGEPSDKHFDGKSFKKLLEGDTTSIHPSLYFEMGYSRGILKGHYKYIALRYPDDITNMSLAERQRILDEWNYHLKLRGREPNNLDPTKPFGHVQIIPGGGDAEYHSTLRYPNYTDPDQLYDLSKDPNEQVNLAKDPAYTKVMEDLQKELIKYLINLPGTFGEFNATKMAEN